MSATLTELPDSSTDGSAAAVRPLLIGKDRFDEVPGGLNRYLGELAQGLRFTGTPAHVLAGGSPSPDSWWTSVPSSPLPVKLAALRQKGASLATGATVLDVHFALHGWPLLSHPAARRLPLVVHFQGPWAEESRVEGVGELNCRARAAIERSVYRRAAHVVVLSRAFGEEIIDRYGVAPGRVEVVTPGVDLARFRPRPVPEARAVLAEQMGVDARGPLVVCVRRLAHRMGLEVLIEAWARVARDVPGATLALAGDGAARPELEDVVRRQRVEGSVRFLGRVSDDVLPNLYAAADLSVVPTTSLEGFGLVTLESLASGTPVVVTDVDGLADVPRRLHPSLVVPPGDVDALEARMVGALRDGATLPSRDICRRFAEDYSWVAVAERHLEIYRSVAGAPLAARRT